MALLDIVTDVYLVSQEQDRGNVGTVNDVNADQHMVSVDIPAVVAGAGGETGYGFVA